MKSLECTVDIAASPEAVFDLIHDYDRRLEWDPFLCEARILGDDREAGPGVRALCRARKRSGGGAMETVYVSYQRPSVAAVKMIHGPIYLAEFVASLRQLPLPGGSTRVSYKFHLLSRPAWLRPLMEPILALVFRRETRRRLAALRSFLEAQGPRTMERVFAAIYRANAWGSAESVSGPGSTRQRGSDFLAPLAAELRDLGVRVLLDAPCGDFNWIAPLADAVEQYIGVDVVSELVAENLRRHGGPRRTFLHLDLTRDPLPQSDAVLCRDGLVHLSAADIRKALANLRRSGAHYLITTTFIGERTNEDIETGGWRPLNLQRPPFSFPEPLRLIDERCLHTNGLYADKRLGIWRMAAVPDD